MKFLNLNDINYTFNSPSLIELWFERNKPRVKKSIVRFFFLVRNFIAIFQDFHFYLLIEVYFVDCLFIIKHNFFINLHVATLKLNLNWCCNLKIDCLSNQNSKLIQTAMQQTWLSLINFNHVIDFSSVYRLKIDNTVRESK